MPGNLNTAVSDETGKSRSLPYRKCKAFLGSIKMPGNKKKLSHVR